MPKAAIKLRKKHVEKNNAHTLLAGRYISITQDFPSTKLTSKSPLVDLLLEMASCTNTFSLCTECKLIFKTSKSTCNHDKGKYFALSKVFTKKKFNRPEDRCQHVLNCLKRWKALSKEDPSEYLIWHYSNERFCKPPEDKSDKPINTDYTLTQTIIKNGH